jgi:WD40 repeat protein
MTGFSNPAEANSYSQILSRQAEILSLDLSADGARAAIVWQLGRYIDLIDLPSGSLFRRWDRESAGPRFGSFVPGSKASVVVAPYMHKSLSRERVMDAAVMIMDASSDTVLDIISHDKTVPKRVVPEKIIFSPDANSVAFSFSATPGRPVAIYTLATMQITTYLQLRRGETSSALSFSPDSRFVAVGTRAGTLIVFDAADASRLFSVAVADFSIGSICYSPDGSEIAIGEAEGWGENQKKTRISLVSAHDGRSVATSAGSYSGTDSVICLGDNALITGSGDGIVRRWNRHLTHNRILFSGGQRIKALALSPSKKLIYTVAGSNLVAVKIPE